MVQYYNKQIVKGMIFYVSLHTETNERDRSKC